MHVNGVATTGGQPNPFPWFDADANGHVGIV